MNRQHSFESHLLPCVIELAAITIIFIVSVCSPVSAASLSVNLAGTGGGTITSDPAGISCAAAGCSADFTDGSTVNLLQTPDAASVFSGWSGACTNTSGNCSVAMDGDKTATANFTAAPMAMIGTTAYASLGAAYTSANSGDVIEALDSEMPDNGLDLNAAKEVIIIGGYNADYSGKSQMPTFLRGLLSISSGSLLVDGLTIIPDGGNISVAGVTLKTSTGIQVDGTETLVATISPANATNQDLIWSTSDASVASISATSGSSVTVTGVSSGTATITVTTEDGDYTATCEVSVAADTSVLSITGFSPSTGPVDTEVTIYGTSFSTTPADNIVKFNGTTATVTASTATAISTTIPAGTTTGTVSVTVGGRTAASSSEFTVQTAIMYSMYDLTGFAFATTGGGVVAETDPAYAKVYTPQQLVDAVYSWYKGKGVKVIEIMNDLNLGQIEVGDSVLSSTAGKSLLLPHATPKLHPALISSGVSKLDIKGNSGLTIFSANGATIRHCTFNIKGADNIIIRNLRFDEMWEWDEASKGDYDKNDWDFIDIGNGSAAYNVWIDHCTFTKAYDGYLDIKAGSSNVTFSWNKYVGDDGATNPDSFVRQQLDYLEANSASYPMYNFLRTHGFSIDDIATIIQGHDKTHLLGSNEKDPNNATINVTSHHEWYVNVWDRNPVRLRGGNVHVYNNFADDTVALAAKRLRDERVGAMSKADQSTINSTYSFNPPLNGTISTEGGAILVEKSIYQDCLYPLRNNQTDVNDATYTGKILALDTIYHFDNTDGSITELRGNSTDPDLANLLGPVQAAIIPFSWNTDAWNAASWNTVEWNGPGLPYTYAPDDPADLKSILSAGAGAGILGWDKSNWLKTSY